MAKNLEEKNPFAGLRYFPMLFLSLLNPLFSSYQPFSSVGSGCLKASLSALVMFSCLNWSLPAFYCSAFLSLVLLFSLDGFCSPSKDQPITSVGSGWLEIDFLSASVMLLSLDWLQLKSPSEKMEIKKSIRYFLIYFFPSKDQPLSSVGSGLLETTC